MINNLLNSHAVIWLHLLKLLIFLFLSQVSFFLYAQTGGGNQAMDINLSVEKYQLKNGLTVLLQEDRRIPHIYHLLTVKVGSVDEVEGKTGLAHLFEHLMFGGTKKYSEDEYEDKLNSIGAINNAFTSRDITGYLVHFPKQYLETVLEMESDRLENLVLNRSVFEKELEVVKEERRSRTDNNPGDVFEPMMKLVYPRHPYGRPILGWMKDLEKMKVSDLKTFYKTYYAPSNMVLTLTGDFDSQKIKKQIQKYYGSLVSSSIKKKNTKHKVLNSKSIKRYVKEKRAVQGSTLAFGWRGPSLKDEGKYHLDILSDILTGGRSSRLYQTLVYQKQLALGVSSFYYDLKENGVFFIVVQIAPQKSVSQVKEVVLAEIKKTQNQAVKKQELLKSKRSVMLSFISHLKSLSDKAYFLGVYEVLFGNYTLFLKDLDRYNKVSLSGIKKHSTRYLGIDQAFIVELESLKKNLSKKLSNNISNNVSNNQK